MSGVDLTKVSALSGRVMAMAISAFPFVFTPSDAKAQTPTELPAVTVDAPKERPRKAPIHRQAAAPRVRVARRAPPRNASPAPRSASRASVKIPAVVASAAPPAAIIWPGLANGAKAPLQQAPSVGKTGTPLQDLPASVQIVNRNTIDEQGGANLDSAIRNVSGVNQGGGDGFGFAERFMIRGLTPQIYSDGYSEGDQRNGINQSVNGVDHIEVVKGPGSALLGSGPPGGAINIVHSLPLPVLAYGGSVQYGSFDAVTTNLYATGPTSVQGLNFRIDGLAQHTDGFRGLRKGDYEIRPVLSWAVNDHVFTFSVDARRLENQPDPAGLVYFHGAPINVPSDTKYSTPFGSVTQNYFRANVADAWTVASYLTINSHFSYMRRTSDILRNGDGSTAAGVTETGRQLREQSDRLDDFDFQLEPIWKFNTGGVGHTLLTGLEARHQDLFASRATADLPNIPNVFAPVIPETSVAGLNFLMDAKHSGFVDSLTATYLSAYAADQIDVTDKLKLRLSGRLDRWDTELTPQVFVPGRIYIGNQVFQPGVTYGRLDTPVSWSAGVLYKILPGVSPFVGVSESHLANFSTEATSAAIHDPEDATQVEAGVKVAALDDRLALTLAAFNVQRNNVFTIVGDSFVFNDQKTQGFEADAQISVTPEWKILANATIQKAVLTDNPSAPAATGNLPIGVPRYMANLWSTYDLSALGLPGLKIGAGMTYRDRIFADALNTISVPAFAIFDATLTYARPTWDVSVGIKNIANTLYFINANGAGAFVGDPRAVFVKASVHF